MEVGYFWGMKITATTSALQFLSNPEFGLTIFEILLVQAY